MMRFSSELIEALQKLGFAVMEDGAPQLSRPDLNQQANAIRNRAPILNHLKVCAETFKHVRKIPGSSSPVTATATSTGISATDPQTWQIIDNNVTHNVVQVLADAISAMCLFPELQ
jgi:hypothetical protein